MTIIIKMTDETRDMFWQWQMEIQIQSLEWLELVPDFPNAFGLRQCILAGGSFVGPVIDPEKN